MTTQRLIDALTQSLSNYGLPAHIPVRVEVATHPDQRLPDDRSAAVRDVELAKDAQGRQYLSLVVSKNVID